MINPRKEGSTTRNKMSRRRGTASSKPGKASGGAARLTVDNTWVVEDDFEDDSTDPGSVPAWIKGSFAIRHTPEQIAEFREMKNAEYWRKKKLEEEERQAGAAGDDSGEQEGDDGNRSIHPDSDTETTTSSVTTTTLSSGSSSVHEGEGKATRVGSTHRKQRKPEGIIRKRYYKGTSSYLVRWEGLPDAKSTWEAEDKLRRLDCDGLLEEFRRNWVPSKKQQRYAKAKQKRDGNGTAAVVLDAVDGERSEVVSTGNDHNCSSGQ